jgi:hypothetical protein
MAVFLFINKDKIYLKIPLKFFENSNIIQEGHEINPRDKNGPINTTLYE